MAWGTRGVGLLLLAWTLGLAACGSPADDREDRLSAAIARIEGLEAKLISAAEAARGRAEVLTSLERRVGEHANELVALAGFDAVERRIDAGESKAESLATRIEMAEARITRLADEQSTVPAPVTTPVPVPKDVAARVAALENELSEKAAVDRVRIVEQRIDSMARGIRASVRDELDLRAGPDGGAGSVPPGTVLPFDPVIRDSRGKPTGARPVPRGWAPCDGRDGRPDLRGRFLLGADGGTANGATGGGGKVASARVTIDPVAPQTQAKPHPESVRVAPKLGASKLFYWISPVTIDVNPGGGDNRPPFYAVTWIIKL